MSGLVLGVSIGLRADLAKVLSGSAASLLPPHFSQAPVGGVAWNLQHGPGLIDEPPSEHFLSLLHVQVLLVAVNSLRKINLSDSFESFST